MNLNEILGYTEGPWKRGMANGGCACGLIWARDDVDSIGIARVTDDGTDPDYRAPAINSPEFHANASTIVVAPEALEAMAKFCLRVDKGTVRSKKTYAEFISIIEKADSQKRKWAEIAKGLEV